MRSLLRGLVAGAALWVTLPAQAQSISDAQIQAMVAAIRQVSPQNAPGLYSAWGVTPGIIPVWTQQCLGSRFTPEQFDNDPEAARATVSCILRRELQQQFQVTNNQTATVRRVACWWLTGDYTDCSSDSQASYVQRVFNAYQQTLAQQPTPTPSPTPTPRPTPPPSPSPAPLSAPVEAMVEALRRAAPQNAPELYSAWGVTPGIIPSWTQQCLGRTLTPEQFDNDPTAARATVACIMRRELPQQLQVTNNNETAAVQRVACWWLTGDYVGCGSDPQASYVRRVLSFYQQARPS